MRALASSILCVLVLKASCRGFNETDLKYLQNVWLNAIKKTTNEHLFRQSLHGDDFQQLIDVLSRLETSESRWGLMQDIKTVILQNSYEKTFGYKIGIFTNYCGPGNMAGSGNQTVCGWFNGVDECCKAHDSCRNYIVSKSDYAEYPNLPPKQLYFTSLSCDCDVEFYNCIKQTKSIFGELILGIYSVAQFSCFQYEYKVTRCAQHDE